MRRFVADASHELRTPLTTLRGYSALYWSDGPVDTDGVQDAMRRINDEARRMAGIVEALLDLNDLDEHGIADRELVDVVPLVAAVVDDLHVIRPERCIRVEMPSSICAAAVSDRVVQAVLSLATNALRHTPSDATITIRVIGIGDSVRISVDDTGPGIARPSIFRTCSTGSIEPTVAVRAVGAAMVWAIMHAHNGSLASTPGRVAVAASGSSSLEVTTGIGGVAHRGRSTRTRPD
ncbi:HAMP domain-containing histidine kinase [Nocardia vinacea]|uniref:sensor histidine kinase n=1 Tax=Nocardia vinacea TaxID=96468 RepID=UPI002E114CCA|nr:HAMP domain-containing histidine kinase [Nocardia vinacea]